MGWEILYRCEASWFHKMFFWPILIILQSGAAGCVKGFVTCSPCLLGQHGSCSSAPLPVELSENMLQNLLLNLPPQTVFTYLGRPRPFILRGSAGTETLLLNTEGTAVSFKYLFMKISNILKQVEKNNIKKVTVGLIKKCA